MAFRKVCHIIWSGGRGSGKTHGMRLSAIAHCHELGTEARPLFVRESHSGLLEIFADMYHLAAAAFGSAHRNKAAGTIELPNGAIMYFTNLSDEEFVKMLRESFLFWKDKAMVQPKEKKEKANG